MGWRAGGRAWGVASGLVAHRARRRWTGCVFGLPPSIERGLWAPEASRAVPPPPSQIYDGLFHTAPPRSPVNGMTTFGGWFGVGPSNLAVLITTGLGARLCALALALSVACSSGGWWTVAMAPSGPASRQVKVHCCRGASNLSTLREAKVARAGFLRYAAVPLIYEQARGGRELRPRESTQRGEPKTGLETHKSRNRTRHFFVAAIPASSSASAAQDEEGLLLRAGGAARGHVRPRAGGRPRAARRGVRRPGAPPVSL